MYRSRRLAPALVVWLVVCLLSIVPAVAQTASEREVKAAMLYSFTKFVEWPAGSLPDPKTPVSICVLGRDPFGPVLDQAVADRSVSGRPVQIQRAQKPAELKRCQVLFVSSSERKKIEELLQALPPTGLLTVSDMDQFTRAGGVVGFVLEDNKVRFEVNLTAADRARLKISARLLKLARDVRHEAAGGGRN